MAFLVVCAPGFKCVKNLRDAIFLELENGSTHLKRFVKHFQAIFNS